MHYETIQLASFPVVGISVRTTNANGQAQKDIGELWQRFFNERFAHLLPSKESDDVYCVYTDYESDSNGAYTTVIGYKVTSLENIPEGFTATTIPGGTYRVYTAKGKLPECVLSTWMHIWGSPIQRRYAADFDVYGPKAMDANNAEVETYLSVL